MATGQASTLRAAGADTSATGSRSSAIAAGSDGGAVVCGQLQQAVPAAHVEFNVGSHPQHSDPTVQLQWFL